MGYDKFMKSSLEWVTTNVMEWIMRNISELDLMIWQTFNDINTTKDLLTIL